MKRPSPTFVAAFCGSLLTMIFRIALQSSILSCCVPNAHRRQPPSSASLQLRGVKCGDMCGQFAVLHVRRISVV